jgi:hypothetical protein
VGRLIYEGSEQSFDIDDRTLTHLRVVFMNKLRRNESFLFHAPTEPGTGQRSLWIHASLSLVFHFYGSRHPSLNRAWVEALMREADSPAGLRIVPEPGDDEEGQRHSASTA